MNFRFSIADFRLRVANCWREYRAAKSQLPWQLQQRAMRELWSEQLLLWAVVWVVTRVPIRLEWPEWAGWVCAVSVLLPLSFWMGRTHPALRLRGNEHRDQVDDLIDGLNREEMVN